MIAGIDYSISSPAVYIVNPSAQPSYLGFKPQSKSVEPSYMDGSVRIIQIPKCLKDMDKYMFLAANITDFLVANNVTSVGLEGYSYGSTGRSFQIGENTGILKYNLHQSGISYSVYAPSDIKKFATGKGNADKWDMCKAYEKINDSMLSQFRTPRSSATKIPKPVDDLIDAYWVGCRHKYSRNEKIHKKEA